MMLPSDHAESSTAHLHLRNSSLEHSPRLKQHEDDDEVWRREEEDLEEYASRAQTYLSLHSSIQTSTTQLDALSNFLTSFQSDLSDVSGQIADLQGRSREIDRMLRDRQTIALPLNTLIDSLHLPPTLIALIRDTQPGDAWLPAIIQLEEKIANVKARGNVKAAHEVAMAVEGLKAKAIVSLRSFLLNLLKPIRASVRTNIQVVQSSILLKYLPFYQFLQRQAPRIAKEVERSYVVAARAYYETCFRRYARALGVIKARTTDRRDLIGVVPPETLSVDKKAGKTAVKTYARLKYAKIEGEGVALAYQADDKEYKQPVEALFRSLLLVLMDNASAEFTFIVRFFSAPPVSDFRAVPLTPSDSGGAMSPPLRRMSRKESSTSVLSFSQLLDQSVTPMDSISEYGGEDDERDASVVNVRSGKDRALTRDAVDALTSIWKQVMDPALEYCQTFFNTVTDRLAPPPAVPLMSMIRLNDAILAELDDRGCTPLEPLCMSLKLALWPLFQKEIDAQVESLKKLTEAAIGGGLGAVLGRTGPKDSTVIQVAHRYAVFYSSLVALSESEADQMLFGSLLRVRTELQALIKQQASKIKSPQQVRAFLEGCHTSILDELKQGDLGYSQLRQEIGYWEARRKDKGSA